MQKANFNCTSYRTGRLKWDVLSDFDISMEEWEKQKKKWKRRYLQAVLMRRKQGDVGSKTY
jgi:hypothetical protein